MIKYRYAIGSNGNPVDVKDLTEETRRTNAPYTCYGCGKELIANLPITDRVKHFSHKSAGDCSKETYLHKLGKAVFISEYKDCLENNRPFIFSFQRPATCNYYADQFGETCEKSIQDDYDLTKAFTIIDEEKQVGDFIPDIHLSTEDGKDEIFVEIAVTHPCEQRKIDSGTRIIELKVGDEQDLKPIKNHKLKESDDWITTYNLNKKPIIDNFCKGDCDRNVDVFVIYESGKSIMLKQPPKDALYPSFISRKVKYREILGFADYGLFGLFQNRIYIDKIRETHFNRFPLKNCFLCRYHGIARFENAIFCKTYKKSCNSNEAVECDRFSSFGNLAECHEADEANEKYNG